jgi:hypothetical protein
MWAPCLVAGIALSAVAFMLRFLVALLREGAPSVCYWVAPVRRGIEREAKTEEERDLSFPSVVYIDDVPASTASDRGDYYLELENENSAKEYASDLIAFDVRLVSDGLGRRSIRSRDRNAFRERRL